MTKEAEVFELGVNVTYLGITGMQISQIIDYVSKGLENDDGKLRYSRIARENICSKLKEALEIAERKTVELNDDMAVIIQEVEQCND